MALRNANFDSPRDLVDFVNGAQKVTNAAIVAGGTDYEDNDILDDIGGAGERIAQLKVTSQAAGVITGVSVEGEGAYTTNPTNPVSVKGGNGSGATFNLTLVAAIAAAADIEEILGRDSRWYLDYWT